MAVLYGIGVGPGDPELITMKAAKVLQKVDVVFVPESQKEKGSIAFEIAKPYVGEQIEMVYLHFPMVSSPEAIAEAAQKAARQVEEALGDHKTGAFLTLGDPSIYSTYGYLIQHLSSAVEIQTIPGIPSFCAAAALCNRPLVERQEILSIIPATADEEQVQKVMEASGGIAVMKVYNKQEKVLSWLKEHDMEKNSVLVKRCGFEDCEVETDIEKGLTGEKQYLSILLSRKGESK